MGGPAFNMQGEVVGMNAAIHSPLGGSVGVGLAVPASIVEFVASALMLLLGMFGPAVQPPEQGIEEARQDKGKKGAESGDPPAV